jgi:magnesium transporter
MGRARLPAVGRGGGEQGKSLERMMDQGLKEFYFFSDFLNRRIYNASRQRVGKITDLVAERAEPYPMIIGMMIRTRGRQTYLPWEKIIQIETQLTLSEEELLDLKTSLPEKDIILLKEAVMDKQIVDTFGNRLFR